MNTRRIAQANMFIRIKLFFAKYNAVLIALAPLAALITKFTNLSTILQTELDAKGIDITGVAKGKENLKAAMIKLLLPLARKAKVWAKATNNSVLQAQFNINKKGFKVSEVEMIVVAENLIAAIQANAAALVIYNITPAQITAAASAITAFKNSVGTPQQQANNLKAINELIDASFLDLTDVLEDVDDLLISEFGVSQAAMVLEYNKNRIIGNTVGQHTAIIASIYADDAHSVPIGGATISIETLKRKAVSDANGVAEIVKFKGGDYILGVTAAGYPPKQVPFSIKQGKHVNLDIVLVATGVKGTVTQNNLPAVGVPVNIVGTSFSTITDANGHFSFVGLPAGTYTIETSNENGDSDSKTIVVMNGKMIVVDLAM